MRGWWIGGLLGIGLLASTGTAAAEEPIERLVAKMGWHTDYATGQAAARTSGKPMFVVFRCQP